MERFSNLVLLLIVLVAGTTIADPNIEAKQLQDADFDLDQGADSDVQPDQVRNDDYLVADQADLDLDQKRMILSRDETGSDVELERNKKFIGLIIGAIGAAAGVGSFVSSAKARQNTLVVINRQPWVIGARCQSKQDSTGDRFLKQGEALALNFGSHVFGRTHFWCTVWATGRFRAFPAYGEGAPRQKFIMYNIRNEGIFLTNSANTEHGVLHRRWG